jgi:hypothetical protein
MDSDGIHPRRGRGKSQLGGYPAKALDSLSPSVSVVSTPMDIPRAMQYVKVKKVSYLKFHFNAYTTHLLEGCEHSPVQ